MAKFFSILSLVGFIVPGLDHRFGWSSIPPEASIAADAAVLLGYCTCFLMFRENSFAGRTIEVVEGQKVISSGPYAFVRHPMYLAVIIMYAATPIALGSYWALPFFLLLIPVLIMFFAMRADQKWVAIFALSHSMVKVGIWRRSPFGLVTVILPFTAQALSVPASCVT